MTCFPNILNPILKWTALGKILYNQSTWKTGIKARKTFDSSFRELLFELCHSDMAGNRYSIDLAKRSAGCKNCNQKIDRGVLRIAKLVPNPFGDSAGEMKQYFHAPCIFEKLSRARPTTKKIEDPNDLEGWDEMDDVYKEEVLKLISEFSSSFGKKVPVRTPTKKDTSAEAPHYGTQSSKGNGGPFKDDTFREFRRLCADISEQPRYSEKTALFSDYFNRGSDGENFKGDLYLWVKLLLPVVNKRVYNLQSKQLVKLFSQIFSASLEAMMEDLEQGDVAETVRIFFENSTACSPVKKSTLTLQEVDGYLDELCRVAREGQLQILQEVAKRCTSNDLKMFVRLIKHDLRINAGVKHVLEAVNPTAYQAFQASRDLEDVIKRCLKQKELGHLGDELRVESSVMTPILPMLAEPCRSIDYAFKKCTNGLLVEIKYDGERVQVHKQGSNFHYFSRSLKPVMPHKISHFKDFIPKAFPHGNDLILDSEILLVDNEGKPLPFGTLGAHKKAAFKDASVCLFVFDCLQFNDENLLKKPLIYRRKILQENMTPIKNKILFSEIKAVKERDELKQMIHSIIQQGLEGLVIKDRKSVYEPGKRHWLKMKKDYLEKGAMADSADLVVLGAYYGTGNKGGMMSIFLMGCYNKITKDWRTVCKVHGGHDDATLNRLQVELDMTKISKDPKKVPPWLNVAKALLPDFVSTDPKKSQIWEITGAEFSKADVHTADGISIRFPRVTRIRDDKSWRDATSLEHLKLLYDNSKETVDMVGLSLPTSEERNNNNKDDYLRDTDEDDGKTNENSPQDQKPRNMKRKNTESKASSSKEKETDSVCDSPTKKLKPNEYKPVVQRPCSEPSQWRPLTNKFCLPDVFTGVKLFIPSSVTDVHLLERYFIAYNGDLLKEHEKWEANFVITTKTLSEEECPRKAKQVTPDWLWDCVKLQRKLPVEPYAPVTAS